MNIYRLNDCEWYMANSLEEAITTAIQTTGCTREEVYDGDGSPEPLSDAELDRLKFVDTEPGIKGPNEADVTRTFREELALRVAEGAGPQVFASTEW